jgi:2-keto-3-deoxy-6-phosphogluconate aldolase
MSQSIITPYAAAKIANAVFAAEGMKVIPPQMMYNYTTARLNKGKAPYIAFTLEGGVDQEDLNRWIAARVLKHRSVTTPEVSDPEQEAFDLTEAN